MINAEGQQLGVLSILEARKISEEAGLDLVEVSPDAKPPVCRVMDYGKYKFQMSKRKAAARKKQKQIQVKELKLRPVTDKADYEVKRQRAEEFLKSGDKVKVSVRFRGREMSHPELGMHLLEKMQNDLADIGLVELLPKFEGRQIIMVLTPRKK